MRVRFESVLRVVLTSHRLVANSIIHCDVKQMKYLVIRRGH